MSLNFDPAMTASKDSHWRPTNQWRPRSLTPAARAQYLATKMEPDPQSYGRRKVVVDASFVATQLAKHGGRGPDMAKIQNPQGLHIDKASQAQTPLVFPSGNLQRENDSIGLNQTRCDKAGPQRRTEQEKTEPHKTHSKPEIKTGSQKLGYAKIGFDEKGFQNQKHQAGRKMSNDKIPYDKNEVRTGHDKTGHDLKEPKTGPNKTGQDKTGHSKPEHKMEGSKTTGGHTRTARPVQKETLQPSVLMLGHSGGTPERLRVTPRCHSADPASPRPTPRPARSTGSPYLENQQITLSGHHPPHHPPHHHYQHHQPNRHHHHPSQRYPSHSHHHHHQHHQQPGKERSKALGGSSSTKVVPVPLRRHSSAEQRASSERVENGGGERIGRCPAGAPAAPFYKAALALMQAQRLRGSVVRIPASPSSSSSSSPATSPRNSVFYLPPPPPPPPAYRLPPGQQVFLAQHNPHSGYPNHGSPKSILRPPPSPVQRSRVEMNSGPSISLTHSARPRSTQPPVSPRPSDSLRGTPRKKVTFGNDVIVHLRHHDVGATGRVLSSTV